MVILLVLSLEIYRLLSSTREPPLQVSESSLELFYVEKHQILAR